MVWFQCEDCGENLKKPKLSSHFRACSAYKLSCIDCGEIFGQDTVQNHTQCITEAEKYGPKGQGKALNSTATKPKKETRQQSDIDINLGLSERPPWFCSLCNTKATSRQTLLLHADGKKHRAKARAFHAARKQPNKTNDPDPGSQLPIENAALGEPPESKELEQPKLQAFPDANDVDNNLESENNAVVFKRKRKLDSSDFASVKKKKDDDAVDAENGEVIQGEQVDEGGDHVKNDNAVKSSLKKIKWKKLIKPAIIEHGSLKIKKVRKLVLRALQDAGITVDETQLRHVLKKEITSSAKFVIDGKFVHLVAKE